MPANGEEKGMDVSRFTDENRVRGSDVDYPEHDEAAKRLTALWDGRGAAVDADVPYDASNDLDGSADGHDTRRFSGDAPAPDDEGVHCRL